MGTKFRLKFQYVDDKNTLQHVYRFKIAEIANTTNGFRVMSQARDNAVEALIRHLRHRDDRENKLAKILFVLPILTGCCPRELAGELFAPIIGDADLERVIASVR